MKLFEILDTYMVVGPNTEVVGWFAGEDEDGETTDEIRVLEWGDAENWAATHYACVDQDVVPHPEITGQFTVVDLDRRAFFLFALQPAELRT